MIEHVIFTPEADDDVVESYNWYERREPGLGEDFLRAVEACILLTRRNPEMWPVAVDEFRRALVRRFPYEIFYERSGKRLIIHSIFNCSQNPQKWRERLGY